MTKSENKRILVTGGAGFVGAHLVRRLTERGYEVHLLMRPSTNTRRLRYGDIQYRVKYQYGDLTDEKSIRDLIQKVQPQGIFHLGASTIMSGVAASPEEVMRVNFSGTVNLLNACQNIPYDFFINTGSFSEYGSYAVPIKESFNCVLPDPEDKSYAYAKSKLMTTMECQRQSLHNEKPIVTFRLFTPYGPYIQKGRLMYNVLANALYHADIKMTSPEIVRDFIYVDDIVDLYLEGATRAVEYRGEIFNVASGVKTSLDEVVQRALAATKSKSRVIWNALPSVSYDSDMIQADMTKTFSSFRWRPRYSFEAGLQKTAKWFKENLNFYQT